MMPVHRVNDDSRLPVCVSSLRLLSSPTMYGRKTIAAAFHRVIVAFSGHANSVIPGIA
jgi:hypothetical protein